MTTYDGIVTGLEGLLRDATGEREEMEREIAGLRDREKRYRKALQELRGDAPVKKQKKSSDWIPNDEVMRQVRNAIEARGEASRRDLIASTELPQGTVNRVVQVLREREEIRLARKDPTTQMQYFRVMGEGNGTAAP